jgi:hypothetical protein
MSLRLHAPARRQWSDLLRRTPLFARGRFALYEGLRLLKKVRGLRRLWLPALLCNPVLEAVAAAGVGTALYDIDEQLGPRLVALTPQPGDGLLVVHYFGLLQNLQTLGTLQRLPLVEDCAHLLPAAGSPGWPAARGDIAVFSLRKPLPVPAGGLLMMNDPELARALPVRPGLGVGDVRTLVKFILMIVERVAVAAGWNVLPFKDRLPVVDARPLDDTVRPGDEYDRLQRASFLIPMILRYVDGESVVRWRREGYHRIAEHAAVIPGVRVPVPEAPPGSVPEALPIWVAEPARVARRLRDVGVEAMRWPGAEQIAIDERSYPGATAWLNHGLCLPLGLPITPGRLQWLVSALRDAVSRAAGDDPRWPGEPSLTSMTSTPLVAPAPPRDGSTRAPASREG